MDNKFGKMVQNMTVNGKETKPMVKELSFMLMVIFMKDNG